MLGQYKVNPKSYHRLRAISVVVFKRALRRCSLPAFPGDLGERLLREPEELRPLRQSCIAHRGLCLPLELDDTGRTCTNPV